MAARFHEHEIKTGLKNKRKLTAFLDGLVSKWRPEITDAELDFIFCCDDYLLQINRQFLDHDTLTDIITFDLSEDEEILQGEIYISVERVKENAALFDTTYQDELHRVIFHGVLHLCGFKDKKEKDQKIMRKNEDYCLANYKHQLELDAKGHA